MKLTGKLLLPALSITLSGVNAQSSSDNPQFDEALARKLGADDYGMKTYTWVILKTGPNTSTDRERINTAFRGHLANINQLVEAGKLVEAGPLMKNDQAYRGIFIFDTADHDEVKKLLDTDPAIQEGFLIPELFTWYGSAALPAYLEVSDKVWKKKT